MIATLENEKSTSIKYMLDDCIFLSRRFLYSIYNSFNTMNSNKSENSPDESEFEFDLEESLSKESGYSEKEKMLFPIIESTRDWPAHAEHAFRSLSKKLAEMKEILELLKSHNQKAPLGKIRRSAKSMLVNQRILFLNLPTQMLNSILYDTTLSHVSAISGFILRSSVIRSHIASCTGKQEWEVYQQQLGQCMLQCLKTLASTKKKMRIKIGIIPSYLLDLRMHMNTFVQTVKQSALLDEERDSLVALGIDVETKIVFSQQLFPLYWNIACMRWTKQAIEEMKMLENVIALAIERDDAIVNCEELAGGEKQKVSSNNLESKINRLVSFITKLSQYVIKGYVGTFRETYFGRLIRVAKELVNHSCDPSNDDQSIKKKIHNLIVQIRIIMDHILIIVSTNAKSKHAYMLITKCLELHREKVRRMCDLSVTLKQKEIGHLKKQIFPFLSNTIQILNSGHDDVCEMSNQNMVNYVLEFESSLRNYHVLLENTFYESKASPYQIQSGFIDLIEASIKLVANFSMSPLLKTYPFLKGHVEKLVQLINSVKDLSNEEDESSIDMVFQKCQKVHFGLLSIIPSEVMDQFCLIGIRSVRTRLSKPSSMPNKREKPNVFTAITMLDKATTMSVDDITRARHQLLYSMFEIVECVKILEAAYGGCQQNDERRLGYLFGAAFDLMMKIFQNPSQLSERLNVIKLDIENLFEAIEKASPEKYEKSRRRVFSILSSVQCDALVSEKTSVDEDLGRILEVKKELESIQAMMANDMTPESMTDLGCHIGGVYFRFFYGMEDVLEVSDDAKSKVALDNFHNAYLHIRYFLSILHAKTTKQNAKKLVCFEWLLQCINHCTFLLKQLCQREASSVHMEFNPKMKEVLKEKRAELVETMGALIEVLTIEPGQGVPQRITDTLDRNAYKMFLFFSKALSLGMDLHLSEQRSELAMFVQLVMDVSCQMSELIEFGFSTDYLLVDTYEEVSIKVCDKWKKLQAFLTSGTTEPYAVSVIEEYVKKIEVLEKELEFKKNEDLEVTVEKFVEQLDELIQVSSMINLGVTKLTARELEENLARMHKTFCELVVHVMNNKGSEQIEKGKEIANRWTKKYRAMLECVWKVQKREEEVDKNNLMLSGFMEVSGKALEYMVNCSEMWWNERRSLNALRSLNAVESQIMSYQLFLNSRPEGPKMVECLEAYEKLLKKMKSLAEMCEELENKQTIWKAEPIARCLLECVKDMKKPLTLKIAPKELSQVNCDSMLSIVNVLKQGLEEGINKEGLMERVNKTMKLMMMQVKYVKRLHGCLESVLNQCEEKSEWMKMEGGISNYEWVRLDEIGSNLSNGVMKFLKSWNECGTLALWRKESTGGFEGSIDRRMESANELALAVCKCLDWVSSMSGSLDKLSTRENGNRAGDHREQLKEESWGLIDATSKVFMDLSNGKEIEDCGAFMKRMVQFLQVTRNVYESVVTIEQKQIGSDKYVPNKLNEELLDQVDKLFHESNEGMLMVLKTTAQAFLKLDGLKVHSAKYNLVQDAIDKLVFDLRDLLSQCCGFVNKALVCLSMDVELGVDKLKEETDNLKQMICICDTVLFYSVLLISQVECTWLSAQAVEFLEAFRASTAKTLLELTIMSKGLLEKFFSHQDGRPIELFTQDLQGSFDLVIKLKCEAEEEHVESSPPAGSSAKSSDTFQYSSGANLVPFGACCRDLFIKNHLDTQAETRRLVHEIECHRSGKGDSSSMIHCNIDEVF